MTIPMSSAVSEPVRIPADVERADRVLAGLTARQLAILAVPGLVLYAVYAATRGVIPVAAFLVVAAPVAVAAGLLALGSRDGVSLDRLVLAALRQRMTPRVQVAAPDGVTPAPEWVTARATRLDDAMSQVRPSALQFPAEAVTEAGVIDLGPDGMAVVAVASTVNFGLRTPGEQEALVASFGRYLHSLTAPVQILIRAQRLDLSAQIAELRQHAGGLPHPALEAAAREHADFLAQLAQQSDLLRRQVLLILREPLTSTPTSRAARLFGGRARRVDDRAAGLRRAAETRLARRLGEAVTLLSAAGIVITPLDASQATAVLASACNPDTLIPPTAGLAAADEVITTASDYDSLDVDDQPLGPQPPVAPDIAGGEDELWWAK
ncbi:PrgI family protein [Jatrophihabitans lederbergiae]|uniref:PrgI family protein n=1 Tax=Jatrophihabitans lederbergiae TaxID=3075547 RepID=A0ABU2JFJ1_9ACTN|nr:PrgI family protein [Jatrophihabitans sp. DSM 44399]MDT0263762.1 PrgI family protein [Jatrophihabitans sp. DSM 44399]